MKNNKMKAYWIIPENLEEYLPIFIKTDRIESFRNSFVKGCKIIEVEDELD